MSDQPEEKPTGRVRSSGRALGRARRTPGVWCPELPRAAKTIEEYIKRRENGMRALAMARAAGTLYRHGVPDGWAGKKKVIAAIRAASAKEATAIVDKLVEDKRWEPDNAESRMILEKALEVVVMEKNTPDGTAATPFYNVADRLKAMKMVWDMVQKRPVTETLNTNRAEDFLAQLAEEDPK